MPRPASTPVSTGIGSAPARWAPQQQPSSNGQKQLLGEVTAISQKGLAINNPDQKHHLRQYRGGTTVSALQAACIFYVGVRLLLPGQDAGIDFAREYELAKGL